MKRRTFTLIEILMVMVIIALLMGLAIGGANMASRKSAEGKTKALLQKMETALEQYRTDWGMYPPRLPDYEVKWDESGLADKRGTPYLGQDQGYVADSDSSHNNIYRDAWGRPFYYRCPGTMNAEKYDLWSTGHDEKHGDEGTSVSDALTAKSRDSDDITNWKRD